MSVRVAWGVLDFTAFSELLLHLCERELQDKAVLLNVDECEPVPDFINLNTEQASSLTSNSFLYTAVVEPCNRSVQ